jgi:hypothetical protein
VSSSLFKVEIKAGECLCNMRDFSWSYQVIVKPGARDGCRVIMFVARAD